MKRGAACRLGLALVALASLVACESIPRGRDGVHTLTFRGVERIEEPALRAKIATVQRERSLLGIVWPWTDWPLYDPAILRRDLDRIERFYRARGYYDTQIGTPEIDRTARGERRGAVEIEIPVEEGLPVRIRRIDVVFAGPPISTALRQELRDVVELRPRAIFDEDEYEQTERAMRDLLQEEGYAAGQVNGHVRIDPGRHTADVRLSVEAGRLHRFGHVYVSGAGPIPVARIVDVASIDEGELFRASRLRDARTALYDLGTFSSVRVSPIVSPDTTVVDVQIDAVVGRLQRVRVGVGAALEPSRGDIHLLGSYEHRNLFGGARRLRLDVQPRLIFEVDQDQNLRTTPGMLVTGQFRQPSAFERRTWFVHEGRYDVGSDPSNPGLTRHLLNLSIGLQRRLTDWLFGAASLHYEFYAPITAPGTVDPSLNDPWAFPYFEQLLRVDTRDDPVRPHRGLLLTLDVQETPQIVPSTWDYVRIAPDARVFAAPWDGGVLAMRLAVGWLRVLSGSEGGPLSKRFFVGGANGVRGYGFGRAGSLTVDCTPVPMSDPPQTRCVTLAEGGTVSWLAQLELRQTIIGDFGLVLFADAGDASIAGDVRFDYPHLTVGLGLRYHTIIGPLRFDVGYRVSGAQRIGGVLDPVEIEPEISLFGATLPISFHLALGEAF